MLLHALLSVALSAEPPRPAPEALAALRERADAAYQQKRYAEACKLFEDVTRQSPKDEEAWADLALCRFKLKQKDAAVAAAAKALQLGGAETRRHTYYNLGRFTEGEYGGEARPGEPECRPVSPVPGCERKVWRCDRSQRAGGAQYDGSSTWAQLGWTREEAEGPHGVQVSLGETNTFRSFGTYDPRETELYKKQIELGLAESPKDTSRACKLVWLDACAGRAGLFCESYEVEAGDTEEAQKKATKRKAEEVLFTLPPPPAPPSHP